MSSTEVQALQADLLRQKVVFDTELRNQREHFQTQLNDANEQLKAREIDCRNLQAVVTILGRKLDSITLLLEQQQQQQEALRQQQRYPSRQRSASVSSQASSQLPAPDTFAAFGRHYTAAARKAPPAPTVAHHHTTTNVIGQTPRRVASPMRATYIDASAVPQQVVYSRNASSTTKAPPSINVYGICSNATTLKAPQHAYQLSRPLSATQVGDTERGHDAAVENSDDPTNQKDATQPFEANALSAPDVPRVGVTTPNRTVKRPLVAHEPQNKIQQSFTPTSTIGGASMYAATTSSRPPSPRTIASMTAFRPVSSFDSGVGFRGPLPTRVTPERLRASK